MPMATVDGQEVWQRRDRATQLRIWLTWLVGTAIFLAILATVLISSHKRVDLGRGPSRHHLMPRVWQTAPRIVPARRLDGCMRALQVGHSDAR